MDKAALFTEQPILETDRLILRPIVLEDVNEILAIYSDDEAGKYNCWQGIEGERDGLLKIMGFRENWEHKERIRWGLIDKTTNKLIGDCAFVMFDFRIDRAEVGFNLVRTHWNKGLMAEALKAVLNYGWDMKMHSIEAIVDPNNAPCLALLSKLGWTEEALLRQLGKKNGVYFDALMVSILEHEAQ
jgi:ribosomal-protein-alanine N-acetyltransferase